MTINLSDLSTSEYLASNDYAVGTIMPPVEIVRIEWREVPVPNSTKKNRKAVVFFKGVPKGWAINNNVAREIGAALGQVKNIDKTWIGALVSLTVVGNVRRPDGTKGNAFRLHSATPPQAPSDKGSPGVTP